MLRYGIYILPCFYILIAKLNNNNKIINRGDIYVTGYSKLINNEFIDNYKATIYITSLNRPKLSKSNKYNY